MKNYSRRNFLITSSLVASSSFISGITGCSKDAKYQQMQNDKTAHKTDIFPLGGKVIDAHLHVRAETIERCLRVMDENHIHYGMNIGIGGEDFDQFQQAYQPYRDRLGMMFAFHWDEWQKDPEYVIKAPDLLESAVQKGAHGVKIWKDLGLTAKDPQGNLIPIDDERLMPIWERADQINCIVAFHTVDPVAFFEPWNPENERWEELELHPDWSFADRSVYPARDQVLAQRNNVIKAFPNLKFQCVHGANYSENLKAIDAWLDKMPNMYVDTSARLGELGRHAAKEGKAFFEKHQDRLMFGTDRVFGIDGDVQGAGPTKIFSAQEDKTFYNIHWKYFQSREKQFDHPTPIQGNWKIDGIGLSEDVLSKLYWDNAYNLYGLGEFGVS
jgi:predicted TIM-barrel fold metal-dependent hydrolase